MLRGRLAKRDSSICALCQYRLSLGLGPPQHRLFSVTTQSASNHDPSRIRPFRPAPPVAVGSGSGNGSGSYSPSTPTYQAQTLSTTSSPRLLYSNASQRPADSSQLLTGAASAPSPKTWLQLGPRFPSRKPGAADILDPHEAKARERLLAQKNQRPQQEHVGPRPAAARAYANRHQAIENYLKHEPLSRDGNTSNLKRQPTTLPALSLSGKDLGSNFSIRAEIDTKSYADRARVQGSSLFRRVGYRPDPPLRKVPAAPVAPETDPQPAPPPASQLPDTGGDNAPRDSVASSTSGLSNLARSGGFWHSAAKMDDLKGPSPSKVTEDSRIAAQPPATRFGESAVGANKAAAPLGGFDALEAAGARDAEVKNTVKKLSRGDGLSQEWGQLARKPAGKPNLETDYWSSMRSNVSKSQPNRAGYQRVERASSDPWAITKSAPVADNSISRSPPAASWSRNDGYDREKNKRWALFEREETPVQRRGGKRSQRASHFEEDDGEDAYDRLQQKRRQKEMRKTQREAERTEPIPIILPELISVTAFANALKIKPEEFLVQLGELGFEGVTLDSLMAGETAALVAQEYGYEPTVDAGGSLDLKPRPPPEDPSALPPRPPVVTIMGHVDHGKTTILDYLRKSSVAAQEHGGITQHIGAFSVKLSSGKPITFLDTPGHAAFLTMRQRGANVTDIVVLVVAADDSVKPQTLEALKHARAAKVPIIVAINKIDKDGARIDAVKADLAKAGIEIEDYGGDVQVVCVSGKTGQGMDDLEENILTLSEILDHRAETDGPAEGWVLESSLKSTGKVATVLVKRGTLRPGDYIAAGLTWAKIRQLRNEAGVDIDEASPGTPVEILGWRDLPAAGDQVIQSPDEDKAKTAVSYREGLYEREKDAAEYETITEARRALQEKRAREKAASEDTTSGTGGTGVQEILPDEENGTKMVNFVVKADVHGSVEAVCAAIQEIGSHEVRPRVLRSATGAISEFDVEHAATSNSVLVNFATTTPGHIRRLAENQGVRILEHTVIYHLIDDVKANLSGYLTPDISTRVLGEVEVLQIFPINLRGRVYKNIAGCRVRNGVVGKNNLYRVMRRGEVVYEGKLETLKHVKKDVMEMRKGTECGMGFEEFQDIQVGDQIQAYEEVRTARNL
ncbi:hypothetical protein F4801DRAFT_565717 [Xylaria longipes]|nr:hypothetical protein F4801DRAFT_565717 [Xylaria longipes]